MTHAEPWTRFADDSESASARLFNRAAIIVFGFLVWRVLTDPLAINHDCAALIMAAEMALDGQLPYVDFYEVNPPLIIYLSAIPVLIARLFGVDVILVFSLLVLIAIGASTLALRHILLGPSGASPRRAALIVLASLIASVLTSGEGFFDFGQREHFLFLLATPFVALRALRWDGALVHSALATALGAAASIAVAVKPHYALVAIAPDIVFVVRARRLRPLLTPEIYAFIAATVLYAAHFAFLPAAMRDAFFSRWLPIILSGYSSFDAPLVDLLQSWRIHIAAILAAVPFVLRVEPPPQKRTLVHAFIASTAGGIVGYFVQKKGWTYHAYPALATSLVVAAALIAERAPAFRVRAVIPRLAAALAIGVGALVVVAAVLLATGNLRAPVRSGFHIAIVRHTNPGDRVLYISTSAVPGHPAFLQLGRRLAARYYVCQWMIPVLYEGVVAGPDGRFPYRTRDALPESERHFLAELGDDIKSKAPPLIIVSNSYNNQFIASGFNFIEYLTHTGFLTKEMSGYRAAGTVDGHVFFVKRNP